MLERNTERRIVAVDAGGGLVNVVVGFDPRYIIVDNMSEVDVSVYDGNRQTIPVGTAPFDYVPLHGFKVEPPPVGVRAFTFTWPGSTAGGFVKIVVTDDPKWVRAAHETNLKRKPVTLLTHDKITLGAGLWSDSYIFSAAGYDSIAMGMKNDAATNCSSRVVWYVDPAGSRLGSDIVFATAAVTEGIGRVTVKAPYCSVTINNGDAVSHVFSSWTTLLP